MNFSNMAACFIKATEGQNLLARWMLTLLCSLIMEVASYHLLLLARGKSSLGETILIGRGLHHNVNAKQWRPLGAILEAAYNSRAL